MESVVLSLPTYFLGCSPSPNSNYYWPPDIWSHTDHCVYPHSLDCDIGPGGIYPGGAKKTNQAPSSEVYTYIPTCT